MSHLISVEISVETAKEVLDDVQNAIETHHASDEESPAYMRELEDAIVNALEKDDA